jgi:hypothetical protein
MDSVLKHEHAALNRNATLLVSFKSLFHYELTLKSLAENPELDPFGNVKMIRQDDPCYITLKLRLHLLETMTKPLCGILFS